MSTNDFHNRAGSRQRRSSSIRDGGRAGRASFVVGTSRPLYRRDSNMSSTSFLDDVEMAQDEVQYLDIHGVRSHHR